MNKTIICLSFIFFFSLYSASSQTNFRKGLMENDPAPTSGDLPKEERLARHQDFLEKAIQEQDSLHILYGNLYLFIDYLHDYQYPEAREYLLVAEDIAKASGNQGWQGWVSYRRGNFYVWLRDNEENAIASYSKAASLCGEVNDSLCVAESWEQLGAMYTMVDDFDQSQYYYNQAIPLLEKYGSDRQLSTAFNNYANLLVFNGRPAEAIPYHQRAIALYEKLGNLRGRSKTMNNLANAYRVLKQYGVAIGIYEKCIKFNDENDFSANKISNYRALAMTYDSLDNYQLAYDYIFKYFILKDSIVGAETQKEIAELEVKYESQKKELEIEKGKAALLITQQKLERWIGMFCVGLLIAAIGLWQWNKQRLRAQQEQLENQENLNRLTKILIEKNYLLTTLEEQIGAQAQSKKEILESDFQENLYNQRILTDDDWRAFKIYFEKTYPNYLQRVRSKLVNLSEAEERLFLFIKLNLTRKEMAAILGISVDSVKKTRYRLRKRLELASEDSLEDFIQNFKYLD